MTRTWLSAVTVWPDVRSFADQWYSDSLYSCVLKSSQHNCDFRFQFYCPIHCLNPTEAVRGRWELFSCDQKKTKKQLTSVEVKMFPCEKSEKTQSTSFFFLMKNYFFFFLWWQRHFFTWLHTWKNKQCFFSVWNNENKCVSLHSFLSVTEKKKSLKKKKSS